MSKKNIIVANKIVLPDNIVVAFVSDTLALAPNYKQIVAQLPPYYQQHINHFADANYRLQSALCFLILTELCRQQFAYNNVETYIPLAQNCENNHSCDQEKVSQSDKENNLLFFSGIEKSFFLNQKTCSNASKNNQSCDQENGDRNEQKKPLRCDGMTNNQFVDIQFSANGKPFDHNGKIFFSFSHTPSLAVCAIAPFDIGMDATERIPFDTATARIICSPAEFAELEKQGESCHNDNTLAQLITRKESLLKLRDGKLCQIDHQPNSNDIEYFTVALDDEHICTVCAPKQR